MSSANQLTIEGYVENLPRSGQWGGKDVVLMVIRHYPDGPTRSKNSFLHLVVVTRPEQMERLLNGGIKEKDGVLVNGRSKGTTQLGPDFDNKHLATVVASSWGTMPNGASAATSRR